MTMLRRLSGYRSASRWAGWRRLALSSRHAREVARGEQDSGNQKSRKKTRIIIRILRRIPQCHQCDCRNQIALRARARLLPDARTMRQFTPTPPVFPRTSGPVLLQTSSLITEQSVPRRRTESVTRE